MTAWLEDVLGLTFLYPALLWLALVVPVALWLGRRRRLATLPLAASGVLGIGGAGKEPFPGSWRTWLLPLPHVLHALGLLILVVALARPAESARIATPSKGLDLLLCLDTSSSMTANDMDKSRTRLEVARDAALEFVRGRPEDRIGLVTFARYPDLRCPLTRDHEALGKLLLAVTPVAADGPEDATGIGAAVARGAALLQGATTHAAAIVLLTDGEENVAVTGATGEIAPAHAAQLCERLGIRVHAIAAGTGRPDPSGVWRPPDTRALKALAETTGGAYLEARDAGAMAAVYARIDALEKTPASHAEVVLVDRYLPFLLLAIALVVVGRLLGATVLRVRP